MDMSRGIPPIVFGCIGIALMLLLFIAIFLLSRYVRRRRMPKMCEIKHIGSSKKAKPVAIRGVPQANVRGDEEVGVQNVPETAPKTESGDNDTRVKAGCDINDNVFGIYVPPSSDVTDTRVQCNTSTKEQQRHVYLNMNKNIPTPAFNACVHGDRQAELKNESETEKRIPPKTPQKPPKKDILSKLRTNIPTACSREQDHVTGSVVETSFNRTMPVPVTALSSSHQNKTHPRNFTTIGQATTSNQKGRKTVTFSDTADSDGNCAHDTVSDGNEKEQLLLELEDEVFETTPPYLRGLLRHAYASGAYDNNVSDIHGSS